MDIRNIVDAALYVEKVANAVEAFGSEQAPRLLAIADNLRRESLISQQLAVAEGEFNTDCGVTIRNLRRLPTEHTKKGWTYNFEALIGADWVEYGQPSGSSSPKRHRAEKGTERSRIYEKAPAWVDISWYEADHIFEAARDPDGIQDFLGIDVTKKEALPLYSNDPQVKKAGWISIKEKRLEQMREISDHTATAAIGSDVVVIDRHINQCDLDQAYRDEKAASA